MRFSALALATLSFLAIIHPAAAQSTNDAAYDEGLVFSGTYLLTPPAAQCHGGAADILRLEVSSAGGEVRVALALRDLSDLRVSCGYLGIEGSGARYAVSLARFDEHGVATGDQMSFSAQRAPDGSLRGCIVLIHAEDEISSTESGCLGSLVVMDDQILWSAPLAGQFEAGGRLVSYDLGGEPVQAHADAHVALAGSILGATYATLTDSAALRDVAL